MAVEESTRKSPFHPEPRAQRASRFNGPAFSERKAKKDTVLITEAQASYDAQHAARVRKYSILMAFRIPALVLAAIVYSLTMIWWLPLLIVAASIPLPWMAVLIANDRPPRRGEEVNRYEYGSRSDAPALTRGHGNVIEG